MEKAETDKVNSLAFLQLTFYTVQQLSSRQQKYFTEKKNCHPQYERVISFLTQSFVFKSTIKVIQVKNQEKNMKLHDFQSSFDEAVVLTSFMSA